MYQRILVPLDGSPLAEQVIPYLYGMIKGLNCPIMLLRVYTVPPLVMEGTGSYIDAGQSRLNQGAP